MQVKVIMILIMTEIIMIITSTDIIMNLEVKTQTTIIKMTITVGIIIIIKDMITKKITIQVIIIKIKVKDNAM